VNIQPIRATPRCRVLRNTATVLSQPKASSTRLRRHWLRASPGGDRSADQFSSLLLCNVRRDRIVAQLVHEGLGVQLSLNGMDGNKANLPRLPMTETAYRPDGLTCRGAFGCTALRGGRKQGGEDGENATSLSISAGGASRRLWAEHHARPDQAFIAVSQLAHHAHPPDCRRRRCAHRDNRRARTTPRTCGGCWRTQHRGFQILAPSNDESKVGTTDA
jgi:hypothetical protein